MKIEDQGELNTNNNVKNLFKRKKGNIENNENIEYEKTKSNNFNKELQNQGNEIIEGDNDSYYSEYKPLNLNDMYPKKEEKLKSNLFKTRIIESEINSGLFLQILLYYNMFSTIVTFSFQIIAIGFKVIYYLINLLKIISIISIF